MLAVDDDLHLWSWVVRGAFPTPGLQYARFTVHSKSPGWAEVLVCHLLQVHNEMKSLSLLCVCVCVLLNKNHNTELNINTHNSFFKDFFDVDHFESLY